jgi:hypothetical protein
LVKVEKSWVRKVTLMDGDSKMKWGVEEGFFVSPNGKKMRLLWQLEFWWKQGLFLHPIDIKVRTWKR